MTQPDKLKRRPECILLFRSFTLSLSYPPFQSPKSSINVPFFSPLSLCERVSVICAQMRGTYARAVLMSTTTTTTTTPLPQANELYSEAFSHKKDRGSRQSDSLYSHSN